MPRSLRCVIAIAALSVAAPALAADYADYPELRPAYPNSWESGEDNPLRFEAGVRYWASWGKQSAGFPGIVLNTDDQTQIGEVHGRIDDFSTQTYVKAPAGLGVATTGSYTLDSSTPFTTSAGGAIGRGTIGYIGADMGWLPFGDAKDGVALGALAGYQYWNDSPDIGRGDFVTSVDVNGNPSGGNSSVDNLDIHALRLGLVGTANMNDMFDVRAEVAAVPYAYVTGTLGPHTFNLPGALYKSSATSLAGSGYGAMGELMVGFHPTENLTLRVGGRAWYLEGALDATFDTITVADTDGDPATPPNIGKQSFIAASQWASVFRYGALFELTGKF